MNELTPEEQNSLSIALKVQSAWRSYLLDTFPKEVAETVYQDLHDTAKKYRGQTDMRQLFEHDRPAYFKLIAESIGYASEQLSNKYFTKPPKVV